MANETALAQAPANPALQKFKKVSDLLQSESVQSAIARALPKHMTAERMIRVAMTALQKTPKLADCEPRSLVNALVQASELGLEPNTPLGEAYLIPYWNSKTKQTEAQLMPGYRGLIKLARQSEKIDGIYAEIVYEKDFFSIEYGLNKDLKHRPALDEEDRGKMIGAYSVAKFKDGYTDFEYMNAAEIEKIRKRSKSPDNGPWVTDTGEMWRKTPIRRITKRLPLSVEDNAFRKAVEIDSNYDIDITNVAPLELPQAAVITEEQRMQLVDAAKASGADITAVVHSFGFDLLADITVDRFDEVLAALSESPVDPATEPSKEQQPENETSAGQPATDGVDAEESKIEDLRTAAIERFRELKGKRKSEAEAFLGTKGIGELDAEALRTFLDTFSG